MGYATNWVTPRVSVLARIKVRFAENGRSLAGKRNTESCQHSGYGRAAAQALWPALHSHDFATAGPALACFAHDARVPAELKPTNRAAR